MLELQRLTVPCPHRNYLGLPARTIRPFLSSNCFPNFPPFFPRKTGKAGKTGNISKVWKFNRGKNRKASHSSIWKKNGKYGNTKNCAKKNLEI